MTKTTKQTPTAFEGKIIFGLIQSDLDSCERLARTARFLFTQGMTDEDVFAEMKSRGLDVGKIGRAVIVAEFALFEANRK